MGRRWTSGGQIPCAPASGQNGQCAVNFRGVCLAGLLKSLLGLVPDSHIYSSYTYYCYIFPFFKAEPPLLWFELPDLLTKDIEGRSFLFTEMNMFSLFLFPIDQPILMTTAATDAVFR